MKKFIYLALAAFALSSFAPAAGGKSTLLIKWEFKNVVEGYDHLNKMIVYVDGQKVGESTVTKETTPNSMSVKVKKGNRKIRIENWAQYEGNWELHSVENNYSHDFFWEGQLQLKKKKTFKIIFDIDTGQKVDIK